MALSLVTVVAFALLVAAVVASFVPSLPGALLSTAGVLVYWWGTGYTEPGTIVLTALLAVGVLTLLVDWAGGAIAAKVGGASTKTAVAAGVVGFALFFVLGPLGVLLGVAVTVFALEFYRHREARAGLKAATVTTVGMLASAVVQALLTASILAVMVFVAVV